MRLAPVPMRYAADPAEGVRLAVESSRTTHAAAEAVEAIVRLPLAIPGADGTAREPSSLPVSASPATSSAASLWTGAASPLATARFG